MTSTARRTNARGRNAMATVSLSELDWRIVELVSRHRVVTSRQLELLLCDTPGRTLRHRTERLHRAGLLGRSRPYRERGSAPYHLWPSRRADVLVHGTPVSRGGEPNPLFLAHAAGVTELYALLATQAGSLGLRLDRFEREPRERFRAQGQSRVLAPDALVELRDSDGRSLLAFVEVDLGTMSSTRLKLKVDAYATYAAHAVWSEHYEFCPCLLFLTTSEARAIGFLKALSALLRKMAGKDGRGGRAEDISWFAAGACPMARTPERALSESCWDDLTLSGSGLTLTDCLGTARAPYDRWLAHQESERRAREEQLGRLHSDPCALREHLREGQGFYLDSYLERFGKPGHTVLRALIDTEKRPDASEREALFALARYIGDEQLIEGDWDGPGGPPAPADQAAVDALAERRRAEQETLLATLCAGCGDGPSIRSTRAMLERDGLLAHMDEAELQERAESDSRARARQRELRSAYFARREREARRWARGNGPRAWLHGPSPYYRQVDKRWLAFCTDCCEIDFPLPEEKADRWGNVPKRERRCLFCASRTLATWEHRYWRLGDPPATSKERGR